MTYVQKNNQLVSYFARHDLIIVFPEGGNGFYTDSATAENDKYESYIIKELIPEVEKNFRTMAGHENRVIAGASMGGYGALKFGLKYPEKFSLVGSLAGAIGVTLATEKTFGALGKTVDNIFGPLNSENRKANNLSAIVDKMTPEQVKALPMIYQSCGTEDFLINDNRQFLALLNKKKIKHEYRELPGAHSDDFFTGQIIEFLDVAERHLKK